MPRLIVVDGAGEERVIEGSSGQRVMEVIRDNGVDDLLALCGGCCSCGTCHVWVEPAFMDRLPEMGNQEDDILECSEYRKANSRLSCQLLLTDALDGVRLTVAPVS
jgi:ferredoxin, 2Fe-2S